MKLRELANRIRATLVSGDAAAGDIEIDGIAPIHTATSSQVTFQTNPRYAKYLTDTKAAAIIIGEATERSALPQLVHKNPYAAMALTAQLFHSPSHTYRGQSELAFVHPEASVDPSATLYPFAFVDRGAKIGADVILYPHVTVGENSVVGSGSVLYASVTVMHDCSIGRNCIIHASSVIGADGFGFAPSAEGNVKIPQIGRVIIEDDVEIQAACTIDRGAYEDTIIGRGTKMDDQILIAHGVQLGQHCLIAGQGAIAGSTKIGDRFIMAGCGAVGPSLTIAANVTAGPKVGITAPIESPGEYMGFPVTTMKEWKKQTIAIKRLPELTQTIRDLQTRLAALEAKS